MMLQHDAIFRCCEHAQLAYITQCLEPLQYSGPPSPPHKFPNSGL